MKVNFNSKLDDDLLRRLKAHLALTGKTFQEWLEKVVKKELRIK